MFVIIARPLALVDKIDVAGGATVEVGCFDETALVETDQLGKLVEGRQAFLEVLAVLL